MGDEVHKFGLLTPTVQDFEAEQPPSSAGAVATNFDPEPIDRRSTADITEEGKDLREAAEQTLNIILDIYLDGRIRWVSPSWEDVVGTSPDSLQGKPIADIILDDNKNVFIDALADLRKDDSGSKIIKFSVQMAENSILSSPLEPAEQTGLDTRESPASPQEQGQQLELEAQGILVFDRATGNESHAMWMVRPAIRREVTIDLPKFLVESLGDGAEMLAHHLTEVAKHGNTDPEHNPPPLPVLCRICERQVTPWWFPKHTELCLQEHQIEADLHMAQENLTEHRNTIVKVLDALEAQARYRSQHTENTTPPPPAEYEGVTIGSDSSRPSSIASQNSSPSHSRERSTSELSHPHQKSFAVRRPLARIVELVLDLCDTALEINQPSLKDNKNQEDGELRSQSPQSEGRISQVLQWQSPNATIDSEPGLSALSNATANLAKAKVDAVMLYRRILEYSERIRAELASLVQECIDAALQKAAQITAGEISGDSSDELSGKEEDFDTAQEEKEEDEDEKEEEEEEEEKEETRGSFVGHGVIIKDAPAFPANGPETSHVDQTTPDPTTGPPDRPALPQRIPSNPHERPSAMSIALRDAANRSRSPSVSPNRRGSSTLSTRSSSPKSSTTPRSQGPTPAPPVSLSKSTTISAAESDAGAESDTSARSSFRSHSRSGRLPSNDLSLSRMASSRERKRTSLILPRERSITRQESPGRATSAMPPPLSPLRVNKPRLPSASVDSARSPVISPTLTGHEFYSPSLGPQELQHRRQSSAASSDIVRSAVSPRLSFASHPQPRPVPLSIKDFEIIKPISKGAFGSVYLAKKKSTSEYFAIKALKKQDMVAKNQVANVKAERAIMMFQGESEFVAKLYWTFPSKDYIFLVMEYLNGGDCASLVQSLGALPEDWAKKYTAEVVLGVEHLHSREIVHRDLKPDNLLIDQKGRLKLTDFGLSRIGLIGRQKRALNNKSTASAPDPLKQGGLQRSASIASSRSTSVDVQASSHSPGQTPNLSASSAGDGIQPSYFSLGRESFSSSREATRQSSMHQSDAGDAEHLQSTFRRFSINDDIWAPSHSSPREEDETKEITDATENLSLHETVSNSAKHDTPPQTGTMGPPQMALFDPEDSNRRFVGTPDYLAPETINGLGQDEMSDWWSLGCILFEFLFGYPPFHAKTPDLVFENILNRRIDWPLPEDDNDVSDIARDLMNRLMCLDPSQRLGANAGEKYSGGGEEIKQHPWFADIDWNTLRDAEASFVPAPESIEDTEYFDARGANTQDFLNEFDDQSSSPVTTPVGEYERPYDALAKVRTQVNSMKRGLMPLHIPPHVRDGRSRRLSEPVASDDFGQFSFKNLSVLEKANKDVIQKLRAEAMQAQSRSAQPPNPSISNNSPPSLDSSPIIGAPLKRALSTNRGNNRSASPSTLSHTNSSPSRVSQPSSPLVQFSTGAIHERRKTSGGSSISQPATSLPGPGFLDMPKFPVTSKTDVSTASSPVKNSKAPSVQLEPMSAGGLGSTSPRARSHTVGSNDSDVLLKERIANHNKRRSQVIEVSPSSSDTEDPRSKALLRVQRRRQSSRRMSQISLGEGPVFRSLDILVVEDHPVSRLVMEKLLEKLRCRTIIVSDGAEAMRYAMSAVKFDIVMTEVKLPRVNGADVARMLRETKNANCHTPIVAVTGYLKELTAPHHFDALVEKPATAAKLTEVMSRLCQWKAPTPGLSPSQIPFQQAPMPPSGLRQGSLAMDESPTSTSSGYPSLPSLSYRASSREDSLSTGSVWTTDGDLPGDQLPKHSIDEWRSDSPVGGLGISEGSSIQFEHAKEQTQFVPPPLIQQESAPPDLDVEAHSIRKEPSAEQIEAKKKALNAKDSLNTGESGDDEDDELGSSSQRLQPRSPNVSKRSAHARVSSKLSTEMMRSSSQGTIVESSLDKSAKDLETCVEDVEDDLDITSAQAYQSESLSKVAATQNPPTEEQVQTATLTPPEIFPQLPGNETKDIHMDVSVQTPVSRESMVMAGEIDEDQTPRPEPTSFLLDPDPTPKASGNTKHGC